MSELKDWEKKILAEKHKDNTYIVISNGQWLCNKIKGQFFVKNEARDLITDYSKVIKI